MYDYIVIGAGIVGLATAYQIQKMKPDASILVLEKEGAVARHQTGRNSGVIHTGIYHKPGSLKAKNCIRGRLELLEFCEKENIPFTKTHKLIIATHKDELLSLHEIYQRGVQNRIPEIRLISPAEIKEIEPYATGIEAIYVPSSAVIDYKNVAMALSNKFKVSLNTNVLCIVQENESVILETTQGPFKAKKVLNCAGLYSDRLAKTNQIIPFRGEYYRLKKPELVNGLIYPVPDPKFPFLGVHMTRMFGGYVEVGPNAVFSMGREGYGKEFSREILWSFAHRGFWKLALKHWKAGGYELLRSYSKALFLRDAQKLIPSIQKEDLTGSRSGIRAQVVNRDGSLMDDFAIQKEGNVLHVVNAPSPAATASFAIGRQIAEMIG